MSCRHRQLRFKGGFPGNMALTASGRTSVRRRSGQLQASTSSTPPRSQTGVDAQGRIVEPDNSRPSSARVKVGRYPFGITLSPRRPRRCSSPTWACSSTPTCGRRAPTGDPNVDYPLCYPGVGYPDETTDKTIEIKKVDPHEPAGRACAIPMASAAATSRPTGTTRSPAGQPQRARVFVGLRAGRGQPGAARRC